MLSGEDVEARNRAIRARWRSQGFIIMPDGESRDIRYVTAGFRVAGESWFDAVVELVRPEASWFVVFTDDSLTIDERHREYLENNGGAAMAVSIINPAKKKIISECPVRSSGYGAISDRFGL